MKDLNELRDEIVTINNKNGWNDKEHELGTWFMLIVTEVAEACEADRIDKVAKKEDLENPALDSEETFKEFFTEHIKNTVGDELADVIIRTLHICAIYGIDIERHVRLKLKYNKTRGYHHGGKKY